MKYYVIADLHGRFDLLDKALNKILEHVPVGTSTDDFKIITLGDYVDRGPQSKEIIECLIDAQKTTDNIICLQGNHEAIMIESIVKKLDPEWWVGNGGGATLLSYGHPEVSSIADVSYSYIPEDHIKWMASLPIYYEAEKQIFVHAGIPQWEMKLPPRNPERAYDMQWMLYDKRESGGWKGKHVVHGHHQFADGPHQWISAKTGGRTDLDTWAYHTGRIVIGVFDDSQLHAIEFIEVTDGTVDIPKV